MECIIFELWINVLKPAFSFWENSMLSHSIIQSLKFHNSMNSVPTTAQSGD